MAFPRGHANIERLFSYTVGFQNTWPLLSSRGEIMFSCYERVKQQQQQQVHKYYAVINILLTFNLIKAQLGLRVIRKRKVRTR